MRLLGYPQEKITILCAYYGQKKLIEEIATKRCGKPVSVFAKSNKSADPASISEIFGYPGGGIKTVDEYQESRMITLFCPWSVQRELISTRLTTSYCRLISCSARIVCVGL